VAHSVRAAIAAGTAVPRMKIANGVEQVFADSPCIAGHFLGAGLGKFWASVLHWVPHAEERGGHRS
jgi:hypothetical protein